MSEEAKLVEQTEVEVNVKAPKGTKAPKEPKAPREPKEPKEPKAPRLSARWTNERWEERLATLTVEEVPDGWLPMSEIVKKATAAGIKISRICSAMGGDRAFSEPWDPIFKVVYVKGRKYGSPLILDRGFELLLDPEYHKTRRAKKEKAETSGNPEGGEKTPVKIKVSPPAATWVAK